MRWQLTGAVPWQDRELINPILDMGEININPDTMIATIACRYKVEGVNGKFINGIEVPISSNSVNLGDGVTRMLEAHAAYNPTLIEE